MNILIIEDEKLTAEDLAQAILATDAGANIVAILGSVGEAKEWFLKNDPPDLVFSDIQLGDGSSFEIFKAIKPGLPVIFCTAYDEYALHAFKANGIDYILKPFSRKTITAAMEKYRELKKTFSSKPLSYESLLPLFESQRALKQGSVLVYQKDKILPVRLTDVALFYIANEVTHLITFEQKNYSITKTLEDLELLSGPDFYRANRQYLVNRRAVKDASQYFSRKLSLNLCVSFPETITISKEKTGEFLNWLSKG
jgi:two-component system response regulator LytT